MFLRKGPMTSSADLLPLVYDELRKLAHRRMAGERAGHVLQATALVHEAYLRVAAEPEVRWSGRAHFFGAAAHAMRRILVEWARSEKSRKRGGDHSRVALDEFSLAYSHSALDLIALDEALLRLGQIDPRKCEVVMLRYFAGLSVEETSAIVGISPATFHREWAYARAWLHEQVTGSER